MAGRAKTGSDRYQASSKRAPAYASRGRSSLGCLVWLILFSLIFLLFVVNWPAITATLERTNFNEILKSQRQPTAVSPVNPASKVEDPAGPGGVAGKEGGSRNGGAIEVSPGTSSPAAAAERALTEAGRAGSGEAAKPANSSGLPATGGNTAAGPAASNQNQGSTSSRSRAAILFFVRIDDDGVIVRQDVTRLVAVSETPLNDALQALVRGPNDEELRQHLVSLIPAGTQILWVRMQGTTALVNLNEAFMYNHYGIEGYAGQLKQIVYTATAFPAIHDVQILIDGQRHDYLGGEGVYIGKPLSRNSF